ncbi:TPA: hypothetical protein MYN98_001653 [Klebsiella quasipneumoniae subsp. similipneumoniae]|nr:hypothetical protein [Klebsiella quasipneumoniae subsp. similipneumoniae]HCB1303642.1 hypothetical protein [Klebsiella quasipneumoniae subsp. similipneumoniae]
MGKRINNLDKYDILNPPCLDFSGIDREIKFTRSDFLKMAEADVTGIIDFNLFGGWLKIKGDGLYVNTDHEDIVDLTPMEASLLSLHPIGNTSEPVLKFPFAVNELIELLKFTNQEGIDFPISHDVLYEIISYKQKINNPDRDEVIEKTCSSSLTSVSGTQKRERGVDKIYRMKKELKEEIIKLAQGIWFKEGDDSEYGLTEMAEMIRDELIHKGNVKVLKVDSIKRMLRPIAPDYAKKPGRPKKT